MDDIIEWTWENMISSKVNSQIQAMYLFQKQLPSLVKWVLSLWLDKSESFVEVLVGVGRLNDARLVRQILAVLLHNERVFPGNMETVEGVGG